MRPLLFSKGETNRCPFWLYEKEYTIAGGEIQTAFGGGGFSLACLDAALRPSFLSPGQVYQLYAFSEFFFGAGIRYVGGVRGIGNPKQKDDSDTDTDADTELQETMGFCDMLVQ